MTFAIGAEQPALKLIDADRSPQEFFALPNMQGDGMPARCLVFGQILKGISAASGHIISKYDIRHVRPERLRVTSAVRRLPRMAA